MKTLRFVPILALAIVTLSAHAGAWGPGAFENDDVLDWVWELESSTGYSALETAFERVTSSRNYIQAPDGSVAVAAAEVVAALRAKPHAQLPEEVAAWVAKNKSEDTDKLADLARTAIARVQDVEKSELAQLWGDSPVAAKEWKAQLEDLAERLK